MADWTDPSELQVVVGDRPRAAQQNGLVDNATFLYDAPGVAVRLTAPQEVAGDTDALISWSEAPWDSTGGAMWDAGSPGSILIPRSGRWLFHCSTLWDGSAGDDSKRAIFLERDDVRIRGVQVPAVNPAEVIVTGITNLAEDSFLEFVVRQTSGGPLDLRPNRTVATVQWVGPMVGPPDEADS